MSKEYYNTLISTWSRELEMISNVLYSLELDKTMDKTKKAELIQTYKNRVKRCKYNITKAKNLQNKG